MTFDLDRNSWRAFQGGMGMQVASLTSIKGPLDPDDAVKSALKAPQVRCVMNSESLAQLALSHVTRPSGCDTTETAQFAYLTPPSVRKTRPLI